MRAITDCGCLLANASVSAADEEASAVEEAALGRGAEDAWVAETAADVRCWAMPVSARQRDEASGRTAGGIDKDKKQIGGQTRKHADSQCGQSITQASSSRPTSTAGQYSHTRGYKPLATGNRY